MRTWKKHKKAVLAANQGFAAMVLCACFVGLLLWGVLAYGIVWRLTMPLALDAAPLPPPAAVLQNMAPDGSYPQVVTKHTLLFAALSETSVAIARDVNRCFYYVSGRAAFVTSTSGGRHRLGSAHYRLQAIDFRLRHLTQKERIRVLNCAEVLLGKRYYVELERTPLHLHAALRAF